jgi:lipoprotein-anchoring transpeptidase ErfK/SrfK
LLFHIHSRADRVLICFLPAVLLLITSLSAAQAENAGTPRTPAPLPGETAAASTSDPVAQLPAPPEDSGAVVAVSSNEAVADRKVLSSAPQAVAAEVPLLSAPDLLPQRNVAPTLPVVTAVSATSLRQIARAKNLALPLANARIVIDKSQRRLDLFSRDALVKSYRVSLGKNPQGAKASQGDGRTPEGRFYICTRNTTSTAFHIFLGLSYPALPDAQRAVNNKQISWRDYQIINQRLVSRGRPPWETRLGGWVGIHGGTEGSFAQKKMRERGTADWTAGCIGLTDAQIEEIYAATRLGTPVEIKP